MLFTLGHGQHIVIDTGAAPLNLDAEETQGAEATNDVVPYDAVMEASGSDDLPQLDATSPAAGAGGPFAYYFDYADALPGDPSMPGKLDALADAMVEAPGDPAAQNSAVPPIFTYLGQFIDHDITATADRDSQLSVIDGPITPIDRATVQAGLMNLRDGSLRLDSLYGDTVGQGPFAAKLSGLMRHPTATGKMRLAVPSPTGAQIPPFPSGGDNAADLLRLGFLVDRGDITQAELDALSPDLRANFVNGDGTPNRERAIIGDARNDENLLVAQLHMSFLRFHNKLVDAAGGFEDGRELTRWHYQWLVVNSYLRTICDPAILDDVLDREAPLYSEFFARHGTQGSAQLPMPLEFSVAAYRFGHSMIRGIYDHNRFFGTPEGPVPGILPEAKFELLFAFTGNGKMDGRAERLPRNWVIEWNRFTQIDAAHPTRSARRIDTQLAPPLANMSNEAAGVFKHLAKRNLRRGYRLSLPTGQACVAALAAGHYPSITPLSQADLTSGATGAALDAAGLANATPLWFYILKEAEVAADGQHLGPLGSILVADTLVGLIVKDPMSYWNANGQGQPWAPDDAGLPGGAVDSLTDMLRFAGMM